MAQSVSFTLFKECQKSHVELTISIQDLPHQLFIKPHSCTLPDVLYTANPLSSFKVLKSPVKLIILKCKDCLLQSKKN